MYLKILGFEFEFGTQYNNAPRQRKSAELVRSVVVSKELSPSPPKVFRSLSDGGTVFPVSRRLYAAGYGKWASKTQTLSWNSFGASGAHHLLVFQFINNVTPLELGNMPSVDYLLLAHLILLLFRYILLLRFYFDDDEVSPWRLRNLI